MATNPMQRKSRNAFLLGMLLMLIIAAIVVVLLYMKIQNQQKELNEFVAATDKVYVLKQDVKSGQIITTSMVQKQNANKSTMPADAKETEVFSMLTGTELVDTEGRKINQPNDDKKYYYYKFANNNNDYIIYKDDDQIATALNPGDKAYYYAGANKTQKVEIEISKANIVVAKVDMKANTILTKNSVAYSDEITTKDLRKEEYNVIALPVDLAPGEYIDVRLRLPNGQNYIVVSKKRVTIPVVNGQYLADTIQMNLTEEENLILSSAIVENYKTTGSILYATRYIEAGIQEAATMTYYPSNDVQTLLVNDPNVTRAAINGILAKRQEIRDAINSAVSKNENNDNIPTKTETSITATQDARKNYLQSLPVIQ